MKQVIVAAPISTSFRLFLTEKGYVCTDLKHPDQVAEINPVGIITSNKLILQQQQLSALPALKWIARLGSGMEIIDTVYCDQQQIRYFSSAQGIANAVAEHTCGMLLNLQHHIIRSMNEIKSGQWNREANRGYELENKTLGIIGYGHTGQAFANKMSVFVKQILAYDKYKQNFGSAQVQEVTLEAIYEQADILSFHVPLNDETRAYYDHTFLKNMQQPHILINTSRGGVASTRAILEGLASGKISGACLDVLEEEADIQTVLSTPGNNVEELLKYPVILTPHIAGYSYDAIEKMSAELMEQLCKVRVICKPIWF